ncbi:DUF721 domain-containing protein [Streptomyces sp. NPDC001939]
MRSPNRRGRFASQACGGVAQAAPRVTGRAWDLPAAGASLRERWAAIAPGLAGHVAAVSFDPDSGQLTVCPDSATWAPEARLEQAHVIEAASKTACRAVVRALRILPPGSDGDP